jgi:hypothetical protein
MKLKEMIKNSDGKVDMEVAAAGAVTDLVNLLSLSPTSDIEIISLATLSLMFLASGGKKIEHELIAAGAIPCLLGLVRNIGSFSSKKVLAHKQARKIPESEIVDDKVGGKKRKRQELAKDRNDSNEMCDKEQGEAHDDEEDKEEDEEDQEDQEKERHVRVKGIEKNASVGLWFLAAKNKKHLKQAGVILECRSQGGDLCFEPKSKSGVYTRKDINGRFGQHMEQNMGYNKWDFFGKSRGVFTGCC